MTRSVLLALVVLLVLPGLASAAPSLRLKDAGRARLLISDGERFLVASRTVRTDLARPGDITVRDLRRGTRRTVAPLPGCVAVSARRGALVWDCGDDGTSLEDTTRGVVEDLRTGRRTQLPTLAYDGGLEQNHYLAAGSQWLLVEVRDYHYRGTALVDRVTGEQQPPSLEARGRDEVIDLDAESGRRTLCTGQRAPLVQGDLGPAGFEVRPGGLDTEGRRAATRTLTSDDASGESVMVFQRCGRPERVLERCGERTPCGDPQIEGRWIGWAREAPGRKPYLSEAVLYDTRSRRRRFIPRAESVELLDGRIAVLRHGHVFLGRPP